MEEEHQEKQEAEEEQQLRKQQMIQTVRIVMAALVQLLNQLVSHPCDALPMKYRGLITMLVIRK